MRGIVARHCEPWQKPVSFNIGQVMGKLTSAPWEAISDALTTE